MPVHGLIEYLCHHCGDTIQYTANYDAVFPVNDVQYSVSDVGQVMVCLSYLGLCGVDSCIPIDFESYIVSDSDYAKQLHALLATINHAIYRLHHQIWRYCHPLLAQNNGLCIQSKRPTLLDLLAILNANFPAATFRFTTLVPRWRHLNQSCQINNTALQLTNNAYLGHRVLNASCTIEIIINLPSDQDITDFLPRGDAGQCMAELLQKIIPELSYVLQFTFTFTKHTVHALGKRHIYLAWNSVLSNQGSIEQHVLHIDQRHYRTTL